RAVAAAEDIEATDDDLDAEFAQVAERLNLEPAAVRKQFVDADQIPQVEADIRLRKALDFLVSTVEIVDEEGNPIDRADFEIADDDTSNDTDDASLVEAQADDAASVKDSNDDAGDADTDSEHEEGNE
ncbi:MAG: hypothetical protein ACXWCB_17630, partial [Acidimicrobiales bacterium]